MKVWSKGKKSVALLAAVILMGAFPGCSQVVQPPPEPVWTLEETPCVAMMSGVEIRGEWRRSLEGIHEFEVEAPKEMAGMQVQSLQGSYTLSLEGLTAERSGKIMENSVFGRLFLAMDGAAAGNLLWENGVWMGRLPGGEGVSIEVDDEGKLLTLSVPVWQLTVRFSQEG